MRIVLIVLAIIGVAYLIVLFSNINNQSAIEAVESTLEEAAHETADTVEEAADEMTDATQGY